MYRDDLIRLRHMLDAAREALEFTSGKSKDEFSSNRMAVLAVVKDIEIIGEAASKVSSEMQERYEAIPWRDITDMRNHLIHAYYDVDPEVVWDTIQKDLPPLLETLRKILPPKE
ncbi:MAG: DUF86 domain-containing protein [Thermodesulfobacteriota bacterium]